MSGPQPGRYLIQLAIEPRPLIGADDLPGPAQPVITEGSDKVWVVGKLDDGNYTLTLSFRSSENNEGQLLVSSIVPPTPWTIRGQDGGVYTIEIPTRTHVTSAWTVNNPAPKSPVTLNTLEIPLPNQLWNFIPVLE